jgi:hypothetical protein
VERTARAFVTSSKRRGCDEDDAARSSESGTTAEAMPYLPEACDEGRL